VIVPFAPGETALDGYRAARASRRRRGFASAVLIGAGCVAAFASVWVSVALIGAGAVQWWWSRRSDPERWLRGAAGEVATAAILDGLNSRRWVVLHDLRIPRSRANIDHLVIGPTGVWVVDTKATRANISASFGSVYFGDRQLDTRPLRWEASVVEERLGVSVRPIVAVHGAGLRRRGRRAGGIRVLPAASLARRIRRGPRRLTHDQIEVIADLAVECFAPGEVRV
jgi:hypothetical protein